MRPRRLIRLHFCRRSLPRSQRSIHQRPRKKASIGAIPIWSFVGMQLVCSPMLPQLRTDSKAGGSAECSGTAARIWLALRARSGDSGGGEAHCFRGGQNRDSTKPRHCRGRLAGRARRDQLDPLILKRTSSDEHPETSILRRTGQEESRHNENLRDHRRHAGRVPRGAKPRPAIGIRAHHGCAT